MSEPAEFPIKPIGEYIVCVRDKSQTTSGGIIIPKGVRQTDMIVAKVLEIGTGTVSITGHRCEMDVAIGDIIMFPAAAASAIDFGVRRVLSLYGIKDEQMDDMLVVVQGQVLGKFKGSPPGGVDLEGKETSDAGINGQDR